jgi:Nucleoside-diphosphate-sugar epimerases
MRRHALVTGSGGLVGSAVCELLDSAGWTTHGIDNNSRRTFFGPAGDVDWNVSRLRGTLTGYNHHSADVRDRVSIAGLVQAIRPGLIVHAAGQPSHDRAAQIPFEDFETNAVGTLNLLEAARAWAPDAPFVFLSTNKVYGDNPNQIPLRELATRFDFDDEASIGIDEAMSVDHCTHSLFGVSKLAADAMVQEYQHCFGMPTTVLRCGCITGRYHSGVQSHGFMSYLVQCNVAEREYQVFGYKGKQVRDCIHAEDVARLCLEIVTTPRPGEVYNVGGGRENSCSILEAFDLVAARSGRAMRWTYVDAARAGDHICYYTDLTKVRGHFPQWSLHHSLTETIDEMVAHEQAS